jgi:hypothetical protein
VEPFLLPGVDRLEIGHAWPEGAVVRRPLERHQELVVGAGQVVAGAVLAGDVLMDVGRTGRGAIPSAAVRGLAVCGVDGDQPRVLLSCAGRSGGRPAGRPPDGAEGQGGVV